MNVHTTVNGIFRSKTYILDETDSNKTWLIDCGDPYPIINYLERFELLLKGILITHAHFDHIYGLNELVQRFPKVIVYISEKGIDGLYNAERNLSAFSKVAWTYQYRKVVILTEKSEISVFGKPVEIYSTPGHDIDCLSYRIENYLFTGDAYIPDTKVFTKWPFSNKQDALDSQKRIQKIALKGKLHIKPGH